MLKVLEPDRECIYHIAEMLKKNTTLTTINLRCKHFLFVTPSLNHRVLSQYTQKKVPLPTMLECNILLMH